MSQPTKPVVNVADVDLFPFGHGDKFAAALGRIGPLIGTGGLGCMYMVVAPGKTAFPFHVHHGLDEIFVVLEGSGSYRFGGDSYPVAAGDVLAAPRGGPERAHQLLNTGDSDLKYLAISTLADPDVVEYPDSGKFALSSLSSDFSPMTARLRFVGRPESSLDYWDGE